LSGAAVFTAVSAGGGVVPRNVISIILHRTTVGTVICGGGEQQPTADGSDQRTCDHHCACRVRCPCSVFRKSVSRYPPCRKVGVRVKAHHCVSADAGALTAVCPTTHRAPGENVPGRLQRDERRRPFCAPFTEDMMTSCFSMYINDYCNTGSTVKCHRY